MNHKLKSRSAAALAGASLVGTLVPLSLDGIVSSVDAQEGSAEAVVAELSGSVTSSEIAEALVALNAAEAELAIVLASTDASGELLAQAEARLVEAQQAVDVLEGDLADAAASVEAAAADRDAASEAEASASAVLVLAEADLGSLQEQIGELNDSLTVVEATIVTLDALPSVADATDLVDWTLASRDAAEAEWLAADDLVEASDRELTIATSGYEDAQAAAPTAGDIARADFRIFRATSDVEAAQAAYDAAVAEGSPDVADRQADLDAATANLASEMADRAAMTTALDALSVALDTLRDAEGVFEAADEAANALAADLAELNADLDVAETELADATTAEADLALARDEAAGLDADLGVVTAQLAEAETAVVPLREAVAEATARLTAALEDLAAAEAAMTLVGEDRAIALSALEAERDAVQAMTAEYDALEAAVFAVEGRIGLLRDNLAALDAAIDRTNVAKTVVVGQVPAPIAPIADGNPVRVVLVDGSLPDGVEIALDGTFTGAPMQIGTSEFVVEITDSVSDVIEIRTITLAVEDEVIEDETDEEVIEDETDEEVVEDETDEEVVEDEAEDEVVEDETDEEVVEISDTPTVTSVLRDATIGDELAPLLPINEGNAISVTIESGTPPAGVVLASDGTFVGTLSESGQVTATVLIVDPVTDDREMRTITWDIAQKAAAFTDQEFEVEPGQAIPDLSPINVGNAIDAQLLAGVLPTGVALAVDGSFVGAPSDSGSFEAEVLVTDMVNFERERRTLTFDVAETTDASGTDAPVTVGAVTPDGADPLDPSESETSPATADAETDDDDDLDLSLSDAPATLAFADSEAGSSLSLDDAPATLAYTGTETTWVFSLAGVGMVIAGAGTLVASRRRRRFGATGAQHAD